MGLGVNVQIDEATENKLFATIDSINKDIGGRQRLQWLHQYAWEKDVALWLIGAANKARAFDLLLGFNLEEQSKALTTTILNRFINIKELPSDFWDRWDVDISSREGRLFIGIVFKDPKMVQWHNKLWEDQR